MERTLKQEIRVAESLLRQLAQIDRKAVALNSHFGHFHGDLASTIRTMRQGIDYQKRLVAECEAAK